MTICPRCSSQAIRVSDDDGEYDLCMACGHHANMQPRLPAGYERDTARLRLPQEPDRPDRWTWYSVHSKAAAKLREKGLSRREIATEMKVSTRTVSRYLWWARA